MPACASVSHIRPRLINFSAAPAWCSSFRPAPPAHDSAGAPLPTHNMFPPKAYANNPRVICGLPSHSTSGLATGMIAMLSQRAYLFQIAENCTQSVPSRGCPGYEPILRPHREILDRSPVYSASGGAGTQLFCRASDVNFNDDF